MGAVYSVRFMVAAGATVNYTVPNGKRAVIKCVSGRNASAAGSELQVWIGSAPVLVVPAPAGSGAERSNLTIVANAGEVMALVVPASVFGQVSGYLLDA